MPTFFESDLSLPSFWRSIILYGKNTASYKFALAKSLIELSKNNNDLIKIDDLAVPFSKNLCNHLKVNEKQITSKNSKFLENLKRFNNGEISEDERNLITSKLGFTNVIDRFHIVNQKPIENPFYIDERNTNKGIRLTKNFYNLLELQESENFSNEVEARWSLVETAWKVGTSIRLHQAKYDDVSGNISIDRSTVTSARNALNGYQKSKCFFCFDYISIISHSENLCDVDHFFPHYLKGKNFSGYIDGIWNLVLACSSCNKGEQGKFAKLPKVELLERLNQRNEYFCSSHHPLRETIILQTGETKDIRRKFLQKCFNEAKDILVHTWSPEQKGSSVF